METTRREFVRLSGAAVLAGLLPTRLLSAAGYTSPAKGANLVLLEAVQFADTGGWDTDQQSMDQMGSAYLLAHGLGVPVKDAVTKLTLSSPGNYRVWVRTRDWV